LLHFAGVGKGGKALAGLGTASTRETLAPYDSPLFYASDSCGRYPLT
jgi:hypothetical protein